MRNSSVYRTQSQMRDEIVNNSTEPITAIELPRALGALIRRKFENATISRSNMKHLLRDGSQSAITESPPPASPKLPDALFSIETSVPGVPLNLILASSPTTTVL